MKLTCLVEQSHLFQFYNNKIGENEGKYNGPFCRYGGHFDFSCFERHFGMLYRGQIDMYLLPGYPIIFGTIYGKIHSPKN